MTEAANILIVDDARLNREVLKLALAGGGYRFHEAENGQEAVNKIQSLQVDLIILDLMMPIMDGFQFLEWRRQSQIYGSIPVIVNSALDDFASIKRALGMGSYDYFTKPLMENDLKIILPLKVKNAVQAKLLYQDLLNKTERLENEIELAAMYQRSLLPSDPKLPGLSIATVYQPFLGVAGDFFDVINLGKASAVLIADVSGHGLLSAMVSSNLKLLFSRYMTETRSPAQTFSRLNRDLRRLTREEDYVTAFCLFVDFETRHLTYASAGHPDQFFYNRNQGRLDRLRSDGFFLGMFDNEEQFVKQEELTRPFAPGDRMLIFTDGAVEAFSPTREPFGFDRWQRAFEASLALTPKMAAAFLLSELSRHSGASFQDDVAFLVVEFGEYRDS